VTVEWTVHCVCWCCSVCLPVALHFVAKISVVFLSLFVFLVEIVSGDRRLMMLYWCCVELSRLCSRMKYWTCFLTTGLLWQLMMGVLAAKLTIIWRSAVIVCHYILSDFILQLICLVMLKEDGCSVYLLPIFTVCSPWIFIKFRVYYFASDRGAKYGSHCVYLCVCTYVCLQTYLININVLLGPDLRNILRFIARLS